MNNESLAHLLLVEDDEDLQELIQQYLEKNGFAVSTQVDGNATTKQVRENDYDLIILDLLLPGKDGISICREIRQYYNGPILILTASGDSIDQVVSLEVGADDFVQKPVEPRVLLARIRALLRRVSSTDDEETPTSANKAPVIKNLVFDGLTIQLSSRTVKLDQQDLPLSKPEYDLLVLLAQNAGNVVSREEIFRALRNLPYDGQSRFVDTAVSQIRKKLGNKADRYLKTVRGSGYLFIPSE